MKKPYDPTFLKYTIWNLEAEIDDLWDWSIRNNDLELDRIKDFKNIFNEIKSRLIDEYTK